MLNNVRTELFRMFYLKRVNVCTNKDVDAELNRPGFIEEASIFRWKTIIARIFKELKSI